MRDDETTSPRPKSASGHVHTSAARLRTLAAVTGAAVVAACAQGATLQGGCTAPEYRRFDFWVGEWQVTQGGKPAGQNSIRSILRGCALEESWRGTSGVEGRSLTFYDRRRAVWHQTWIDGDGDPLQLAGTWRDGEMRLEGEGRDDESTLRHRVTWTPLQNGRVRQHWETSRDGTRWQTVFDGEYERLRTVR